MTRDVVCFAIGVVLAAVADLFDRRYRRARAECEALFERLA